jgi:hypothetical protein
MAELEKLKIILLRNEYPSEIVERSLASFIESKTKKEIPVITISKKPIFFKLPYVSKKCEDYAFRLKNLVENNYWQTEFTVAFSAPMTTGKKFPFKDRIKNALDRSLVVYSLKCDTCNAEYIGKTERILSHRIKEHRDKAESACKQHQDTNAGHKIDYDNVEILDSADNDHKLRIKELLHILQKKPLLNKQLNSQSNYDIKTLIVQAYPQFQQTKQ